MFARASVVPLSKLPDSPWGGGVGSLLKEPCDVCFPPRNLALEDFPAELESAAEAMLYE